LSVSILVVDGPDVAELFRRRFRGDARQGTYVVHVAAAGEGAPGDAWRRHPAGADRASVRAR
jgi:hypothetical protein